MCALSIPSSRLCGAPPKQRCTASGMRLEHDPEKWKPVFRKDHAQTKR